MRSSASWSCSASSRSARSRSAWRNISSARRCRSGLRRFMTERFVAMWMANGRHYRLRFVDNTVDNIHLRIANDVLLFVQRTHELGTGLLQSVVALISFAIILWGLSAATPLPLFGRDLLVPRLSGLRRPRLCGHRHAGRAPDRLAADPAPVQPAALQVRLSICDGARHRQCRAGRPDGAAKRSSAPICARGSPVWCAIGRRSSRARPG